VIYIERLNFVAIMKSKGKRFEQNIKESREWERWFILEELENGII